MKQHTLEPQINTSLCTIPFVEEEDEEGSPDCNEAPETIAEPQKPLPPMTTAQLYALRQEKVANCKQRIAMLASSITQEPEENVGLHMNLNGELPINIQGSFKLNFFLNCKEQARLKLSSFYLSVSHSLTLFFSISKYQLQHALKHRSQTPSVKQH